MLCKLGFRFVSFRFTLLYLVYSFLFVVVVVFCFVLQSLFELPTCFFVLVCK